MLALAVEAGLDAVELRLDDRLAVAQRRDLAGELSISSEYCAISVVRTPFFASLVELGLLRSRARLWRSCARRAGDQPKPQGSEDAAASMPRRSVDPALGCALNAVAYGVS